MADRVLRVVMVGDERDLERSFNRAGRASKDFDRTVSKASRGVILGTGAFSGLGRSVAFASGAFLGGAGLTAAIKSTIDAAAESQRVLTQTRTAVTNSGQSWALYGKQIEQAAKAQSQLTGFDDERLLGTFSSFERSTGEVTKALKLNALAANVARGANIGLEQAAKIVLRAQAGQARGLALLGVQVKKGATGTELLAALQDKFANAAKKASSDATVAQERFAVAVENTQEAIGKHLLPVMTDFLNKASDVLNRIGDINTSGRNASQVGEGIGQSISSSLEKLQQKISDALDNVNWPEVGKTVGDGLVKAISAIDIKQITIGFVKLIVKIRVALVQFGIGLGEALMQGIGRGIAQASAIVLRQIIKIVAPFQKLDRFLPGDPFRGLKSAIEDAMIDMQLRASDGGEKVSTAFVDGLARGGKNVAPRATEAVRKATGGLAAKGKGISAGQRNTFFDNAIGRREDRVQDIRALRGQAAELLSIAARITREIARVSDPTRKLTLGDELVKVQRQRRDVLEQISSQAKQAAADAKQAALDAAAAAAKLKDARQFALLGLSPTGGQRVPGLSALRKVLRNVQEEIKGTVEDTAKNKAKLTNIFKVLFDPKGVSEDVRSSVQKILGDLDRQLKQHQTRVGQQRRHADTSALLAGLGLSPEQLREARFRLSRISPGGTIGGHTGSFALAGGGTTVVMHNPQFNGVTDINALEEKLRRRNLQRARSRRGPYAGRN